MVDTINGRTPEESKEAAVCCIKLGTMPDFVVCKRCPNLGVVGCKRHVINDLLILIQQLEAERDQYKCERDAAERDLKSVVASNYFDGDYCKLCKYNEPDGQCYHHCIPYSREWGWQWRGVQEVE